MVNGRTLKKYIVRHTLKYGIVELKNQKIVQNNTQDNSYYESLPIKFNNKNNEDEVKDTIHNN